MNKIIALLALIFSISAQAGDDIDMFVGVGLNSKQYPNYVSDVNSVAISAGFASSYTKQDTGAYGFDIYLGRWFSDEIGYEVRYTDMGKTTGTTTLTGPSATFNYEYSTSAFQVSVLGGKIIGNNKLYGKLGIFNATTKLEESFTGLSSKASFSESGVGPVFGAGFISQLSKNIMSRFEIDLYNGVPFTNDFTPTTTVDKQNIMKLTLGVEYHY